MIDLPAGWRKSSRRRFIFRGKGVKVKVKISKRNDGFKVFYNIIFSNKPKEKYKQIGNNFVNPTSAINFANKKINDGEFTKNLKELYTDTTSAIIVPNNDIKNEIVNELSKEGITSYHLKKKNPIEKPIEKPAEDSNIEHGKYPVYHIMEKFDGKFKKIRSFFNEESAKEYANKLSKVGRKIKIEIGKV